MTKTTEKTIEQFLMSLVYDHIQHHDGGIPQVLGRLDGSEADIQTIEKMGGTRTGFRMTLNDGTKFSINVEKML